MPDIYQDLIIDAPVDRVFSGVTVPLGLDQWWTKRSSGKPKLGEEYTLWFGPAYDWRALVSQYVPDRDFELKMTTSDPDWEGTRVGFHLESGSKGVQVGFYHLGWPFANGHYRTSTYCWAMYLRILKRYLEKGEKVRYEDRLSV